MKKPKTKKAASPKKASRPVAKAKPRPAVKAKPKITAKIKPKTAGKAKPVAASRPARPAPLKQAPAPMLAELASLAKKLDEAHLLALVTQARAIMEHQTSPPRTASPVGKTAPAFTAPIEIPRQGDKRTIEVKESDDKSSFIIVINNSRNFFTLPEMRILVNICHAAADSHDGSAHLYQWLTAKRKDVLIDTDIKGPSDQALATIYEYLIATYAVKE